MKNIYDDEFNTDEEFDYEKELADDMSVSDDSHSNNTYDDEYVMDNKEEEDVETKAAKRVSEEFGDVLDNLSNSDVLDAEEEQKLFKKYADYVYRIKNYLYTHKCIDFIKYIKSLDKNTKCKRGPGTRFDTHVALGKLYSYTCTEESVVKLKEDPEFYNLVESAKKVRDEIADHNYRLVKSKAKEFVFRGLPFKDLLQEGNQGLLKAIDYFDVSRGNKFSTYGTWWIQQYIKRAIGNEGSTIRIPIHLHERSLTINRVIRKIRNDDGIDTPTVDQIYEKCQKLDINLTYDQVKTAVLASDIANPVSTDKKVGEDEDSSLIDFLYDPNVSTTTFSEVSDDYKKRNEYLKNISEGKNKYGKPLKKSGGGGPTLFKHVKFYTISGKVIEIYLTTCERDKIKEDKEYEKYIKRIKEPGGRERFLELLKNYGINPNILTSKYEITNYEMSGFKKEELIYRCRRGFHSRESLEFIDRRDHNKALGFGLPVDGILTLEKTGKLFGVTRERIRQIETRVYRKMDEHKKKEGESLVFKNMYLEGGTINIFETFNIANRIDWSLTLPKDDIISVDDEYNVTPLKLGNTVITVRNIQTGYIRKLELRVLPSQKVDIDNVLRENRLKLKLGNNKQK